jgi:RNA polymerase sigma factor (sigma-70 family)
VEASRVGRQLRLLKSPDRSFEQLYRRHAREVYQYALALLANPADAEDVTQTTFMNAYRAFQRGERPHKPHNWLIAIAHNVCRMRWRQAGSRPREVALDEAPEPAALDTDRPDLDEVLASLATLTFNQRSALVMRELEGRTYQEISEVLGVSVSAVEALLFRARRRLQVDRKTLGVLTTVPLPGSLGSFFGGGGAGGAVAAGGSLVGVDLAVKGATVLAVGMAAAGVGLKGVEAVRAPKVPPAHASAASAAVTEHTARANRRPPSHIKVRPRNRNLRNAVATTPRTEPPQTPANAAPPASSTPSATAGVVPPAPPTVVKPPALPTVKLPALPALPPPPPVALPPPPPVALPPVPPAPPLPPVKLPPLPPPPPLPPLPPLNNP